MQIDSVTSATPPAIAPWWPEASVSVIDVVRKVRAAYAPPPDLTVSQFADAEIVVTSGPLAGTRWRTDFAPYQRGILDIFEEPGIEIIIVMGSSQWGKTACEVCIAAYHIKHDPCPIMVVLPTVDPMAKDFAKNRLDQVIAASPALREVVSKRRAKDASNTTLAKTFTGGSISIAGANSAASLASRSIRLLLLDEIDRYPAVLKGEGSPIAIALKRTTTYGRRRRVGMFSSPTTEGAPIHSWYLRGDQRKYYVPCVKCRHMHTFEWKNVHWDSKTNDPTTARIHCPKCNYGMDDGERVAVLDPAGGAEWRSTNPDRRDKRVASVHLWEAYSPMSSLTDIVAGFLAAREKQKAGDAAEMHTWENTTLGEPVAPDTGDGAEPHMLMARLEKFAAPVPAGVCYLTMSVDTQDDRLEAMIIGWGPGEESWIVDHRVLPGDPADDNVWAMVDVLLDQQFVHEGGQRLTVSATAIDSAGHRTTNVYNYCHKRAARRVFCIIGRGGDQPFVSAPSKRKLGRSRRKVPLYTIGVDSGKSVWISRLRKSEHGPGFVHLPKKDWFTEELAEQMTSEALITKFHRGVPTQAWKKLRARNEGLDLLNYNLWMLRLMHPNLEEHARLLAQQPVTTTAPPPPAEPVTTTEKPWIRRQSGWLKRR